MTTHINGLADVIDQYDCYLLDIYGLLHNGERVNAGTLDCLSQLQKAGKQVCLFSNTPRRAHSAADDLCHFGITPDLYNHIITAGESARTELVQTYQNKRVIFMGTDHFAGPMEGLGLTQVYSTDQADFILNSIPGRLTMDEREMMTMFHEAKERDLPMICANPDLVVHIGDVLHTCAGTYAAMYEDIGGRVSYHGKPYPHIYSMAFDLLGNPDKSRVCALGDALHTDIKGANGYGIDSIWCLSGIHWEELQYDHKPDHPDMARVTNTIAQSPHKPTATITDFRW